MLFVNTGIAHSLLSLRELVTEVKNSLEPLKRIAEDKFDEYSAVVKEVTITASQWDEDTKRGVRFIHQIRDTQVNIWCKNITFEFLTSI